tara:strand:+ start:423 stop:1205 length:783 start_codon:yes stop_codon:yes gene_type:complete
MPAKYDSIGIGYNRTRQADPYLTDRLYALLDPVEKNHYLDVGCGTGNYTLALHQRSVQLTGVDPSEKMLQEARNNSNAIEWISGQVENLPFEDRTFDGAIATLTMHHWQDIEQGLKEICRVLKKDSRLVLFTSTPTQMKGYWLNHYFPVMMETSTRQMPALELVTSGLENNGFTIMEMERYFVKEDLKDLFLQSGKHNPMLYFTTEVRSGISSFAALSNREEVTKGLDRLAQDIETGHVKKVIEEYDSDEGDYLFIVAGT